MTSEVNKRLRAEFDEDFTELASPGMKEYPFWKDGLTLAEFEIEREYYLKNIGRLQGEYEPLYKKMTPEEYRKEIEYFKDNLDLVLDMKFVPLWRQKLLEEEKKNG